jgi:hypothetical protein
MGAKSPVAIVDKYGNCVRRVIDGGQVRNVVAIEIRLNYLVDSGTCRITLGCKALAEG